ncbi:hypothetical protein G4B88_009998, partial [Cannabis sativa]
FRSVHGDTSYADQAPMRGIMSLQRAALARGHSEKWATCFRSFSTQGAATGITPQPPPPHLCDFEFLFIFVWELISVWNFKVHQVWSPCIDKNISKYQNEGRRSE